MTSFDTRETAFENKYAHDEELRFRVTNRRNKLLGQWAATRLGKTEAEATAYIKAVILEDFVETGDEDVLRKVLSDLHASNIDMTAAELRSKMDSLIVEAKQQVMAE